MTEAPALPATIKACHDYIRDLEATESDLSEEVLQEGRQHRHWKLVAEDAQEALSEARAEIGRLQAMVTSFVDAFALASASLIEANKAICAATPPDMTDQFGRDMVRHINIMGAYGDPDYLKGEMSCRHVDTRTTKPRKKKEAKP